MVVDDADLARQTLVRLLRREGYQAIAAASGREALDDLSRYVPDLILLDVAMPGLDGLELLEILHANPQWQSIPVVMLTGVSDTHVVHRAEQLGAKEYWVKATFSLQQMLDAVRKYTAGTTH
jgi:CheY-like chemotaxis protein